MQKYARNDSRKERIFSSPQNKSDVVYPKGLKVRIPKDQETSIKLVETPSLLTANKAKDYLKYLDGWQLTDDHKMIYREFIMHDFNAAVDLIDRIALIAGDEKHHPDIHLTKYRNLRVGLTTHDLGGLSDKDFSVAVKINNLPINFDKHNDDAETNQQLQNKVQILMLEAQKQKTNLTDQKIKISPIQKPQFRQKEIQTKKRQSKSATLKKNGNKKRGEHMDGQIDKIKGRIKETVGDLTNNKRLKAEGQVDEIRGNVKNKIDKVAGKLKKQI